MSAVAAKALVDSKTNINSNCAKSFTDRRYGSDATMRVEIYVLVQQVVVWNDL